MKRKRGRKPGHKKAVKSGAEEDLPKSPASESTEDNVSDDQTDNAPLKSMLVSGRTLSKPEKPSTISNNQVDAPIVRPKVEAVYGRVRLKLKSRVLEPHQSSSDVQKPSDADKSNNKVPEEINQIAVERDTALSDGQTTELRGPDADKIPRKVGSIKFKSRGLASVSDVIEDKNASKVDDPLSSNQEIVSANKRTSDLLVPNNLLGEEVKQPPRDRQRDEKQLAVALEVIKKVMKMEAAEPFNTPVDPVALGIPDYFDVIDTPMDFGTICHNLEHGNKYMNSEDVYKDVQYIWDNCSKYNSKGDYILELMKRVKKAFTKNWLAAGLRSDVPDSGANENVNNEDLMLAGQEKGHPKSKSKHKRRRHGIDRHKNDCLCAVCVVTRRRKEREESSPMDGSVVVKTDLSEQHNMEENSPVDNTGSRDATSGEQSPQTDTYEEMEEAEKDKNLAIPEQSEMMQPMEIEITGNQMEDLGKCINNQPSDLLPIYNGDNSSQNTEEEEDAECKDSDKKEGYTSAQPNEESTVVHHQQEVSMETNEENEMPDDPIQQENHSILRLFTSLFPTNHSSVWRGPHSLFRRPASLREGPIHAAIATLMKP